MKNIVRSLALAGFVLSISMPAVLADSYTYKVNGVEAPVRSVILDDDTKVITQSAVTTECPAKVKVQSAVLECPTTIRTMPVVVEHTEKKKAHLFHLGIWPLIDFSLF